MPNLNVPENCSDEKSGIALEQLLKLKREERPSSEFWESFDRQLHQRTLQTLVKRSSSRERLGSILDGLSRLLIPASVCAVLASAFAFQLLRPSAEVSVVPPIADSSASTAPVFEAPQESGLPAAPAIKSPPHQRLLAASEARFVLDRLSLDFDTDSSYRKVLAAEPLTLSSDGAQYVADPIGSGPAARLVSQQALYQHF